MQAAGGELEVAAEDLTPQELAAFHRALAAGELSGAVQPWQPWWLSEEAARLELGAGGTALVAEEQAAAAAAAGGEGRQASGMPGEQAAEAQEQQQQQAAGQPPKQGDGQATGSALPPPPSRPLPPLSALTRAAPSPLLRHQLLDLLYAYCLTLRRYNGDYRWEATDAADTLFALSAVLAATAPGGASSNAASSTSSSSSSSDLPGVGDASAGPPSVLLGCMQRACQPPVGSRDARGFAVSVLSDVAAMLQLGRPVVLTALMDTTRLVEAAKQQLEAGQSGESGGNNSGAGEKARTQAREGLRAQAQGSAPVCESTCSWQARWALSAALCASATLPALMLLATPCPPLPAAAEGVAAPSGGCRAQAALLLVLGQ